VAGEKSSDEGRETAGVDGFLNEAVTPDREARVAIPFRGDGDDGNPAQGGLTAKAQRHLVTVEPRNVEVDENQVGTHGERATNTLKAIGRINDFMALRSEELTDEQSISLIILDV
jgi:hypothetical protein